MFHGYRSSRVLEDAMKPPKTHYAMVTLLFILNFSLSAQVATFLHDTQPVVADLSVTSNEIIISLELNPSFFISDTRADILLKDWMFEVENRISNPLPENLLAALDMEFEAELELEDWMLGDFATDMQIDWEFLIVDPEPPLKVEKWMICMEPWCSRK